uniref:PH domain-containing protein n=1 Tax=Trypanosoma vivax (strain Y486) TaxID=1055687 RepID=G0U8F0_TRYVY|nr:conserved hypothetical protein [Trypanosoma vivax Y486]
MTFTLSAQKVVSTLQNLLKEEDATLTRLTYLMDFIHDPLVNSCKSPPSPTHQSLRSSNVKNGGGVPEILSPVLIRNLFANVAALRGIHSAVVMRLAMALSEVTVRLEELKAGNESGFELVSQGSETTEDVLELEKVVEVFCSNVMQKYVAEHMKFSLHYSRSISPCLLEMWQTFCPTHNRSGANGNHLSVDNFYSTRPMGRRTDFSSYRGFVRFLWCLMGGERGVPDDPRASGARMPDYSTRGGEAKSSPSTSSSTPHSTGGAVASTAEQVNFIFASSIAMTEDPHIPANWRGFETLLALLSSPLASLRRFVHVGSLLVGSNCLAKSLKQQLQVQFLVPVSTRVAEEENMALSELAKQDAKNITNLIEGADATTSEEATSLPGYKDKKFTRVDPFSDGSRVLVHRGRLTKRFRRGRHERVVFLFSDWLCYAEDLANGRLRLRASLSLDGLKVVELNNGTDCENSFDVVTPKMRFSFIAPTREQRQQWVNALRSTVQLYEKRSHRPSAPPKQQREGAADVAPERAPTAKGMVLFSGSRLLRQQRSDYYLQEQLKRRATLSAAVESAAEIDEVTGKNSEQTGGHTVIPATTGDLKEGRSGLQTHSDTAGSVLQVEEDVAQKVTEGDEDLVRVSVENLGELQLCAHVSSDSSDCSDSDEALPNELTSKETKAHLQRRFQDPMRLFGCSNDDGNSDHEKMGFGLRRSSQSSGETNETEDERERPEGGGGAANVSINENIEDNGEVESDSDEDGGGAVWAGQKSFSLSDSEDNEREEEEEEGEEVEEEGTPVVKNVAVEDLRSSFNNEECEHRNTGQGDDSHVTDTTLDESTTDRQTDVNKAVQGHDNNVVDSSVRVGSCSSEGSNVEECPTSAHTAPSEGEGGIENIR